MVTGVIEAIDESMLERSTETVLQTTGYSTDDRTKWNYLEELHVSKMFYNSTYCYSLDITGLKKDKTTVSANKFELISLDKFRIVADSLSQALFMKLFLKLNKNQLT